MLYDSNIIVYFYLLEVNTEEPFLTRNMRQIVTVTAFMPDAPALEIILPWLYNLNEVVYMKKILCVTVAVIIALMCLGCADYEQQSDVNVPKFEYESCPRIDGSTANIPLAVALVKLMTGCTEAEAEESIDVSGTDPAYYALDDGSADMLLVYHPAQATIDELDVFNRFNMDIIGYDALVFMVNADNPVESLTADQIRGIYSGKITNWKEVGGNDAPIAAFQRPTLSGSQTMMLNLMMGDTKMAEADSEIVAITMSDIVEAVAAYDNTANAIGYSVFYYASTMYAQPNLKFIAVDGVIPSNDTIKSNAYTYRSPFYAVTKKNAPIEIRATAEWLLTEQGQRFIEECGYVSAK